MTYSASWKVKRLASGEIRIVLTLWPEPTPTDPAMRQVLDLPAGTASELAKAIQEAVEG